MPTLFQKYIFDAYKYQKNFDVNTEEIVDKLYDAFWPFQPENQPEGVVKEYEAFCKKLFGDTYNYNLEAPPEEAKNT